MTAAPIGIFDSGVGGLTVARAINDLLPAEPMLYLADSAHVPYGPRPVAQVRQLTLAACDYLVGQGVKLLVIACNTGSAASLADIRERFDIPVVEVIRPTARQAVSITRNGHIGVIGTTATVNSGAYADAFHASPVTVTSVAAPAFVDFVERGVTTGRQLLGLAEGYLEPLQRSQVDTLVLGCTHYPLLAGLIGLVMGDEVTLVSSAEATAREVYRLLTDRELLNDAGPPPAPHRYLATGDTATFARTARRFLGPQPARLHVEAVPGRHGLVEVVT
jgi:glutamate racemase